MGRITRGGGVPVVLECRMPAVDSGVCEQACKVE